MHTFRSLMIIFTLAGTMMTSHNTGAGPIGHAPFVGEDFQGRLCQGRTENYGPFDYLERATLIDELRLVEGHHFNGNVESLVSGQSAQTPMGDIAYTLYAWPNHHRALYSAIRWRLRTYPKHNPTQKKIPTAECFVQRAIQFSPGDGISYMLYGILLQRTGQLEEALAQYRTARKFNPKDTQIKYNLALVLLELNKPKEAIALAKEIYAKDFPMKGLKKKLKEAGHWK